MLTTAFLFFLLVASVAALDKCDAETEKKVKELPQDEVRTFRVKATKDAKPLKERANLATECPADAGPWSNDCTNGFRTCVFAGQNQYSGSVSASFDKDAGSVTVRFEPAGDKWNADEIHVWVGTADSWTEQYGGRAPAPGSFPHKAAGGAGAIELTVTKEEILAAGLDLDAEQCPETLRVAFHLVQGGETGWAFGSHPFDGARWGWSFDVPACCEGSYEESKKRQDSFDRANLATSCPDGFDAKTDSDAVCGTSSYEESKKRQSGGDGWLSTCVFAGQNEFAGTAWARKETDGVHVRFEGQDGWEGGLIHVFAGTAAGWEAKKGVSPGQYGFQLNGDDSGNFDVLVSNEELQANGVGEDGACDADNTLTVVVHMEVSGGGNSTSSDGETAFAFGEPFPGSRWGWSLKLPCCPTEYQSDGSAATTASAMQAEQDEETEEEEGEGEAKEEEASEGEESNDEEASDDEEEEREWCVVPAADPAQPDALFCMGDGCDAPDAGIEAMALLSEQGYQPVDLTTVDGQTKALSVEEISASSGSNATLIVLVSLAVVAAVVVVALVAYKMLGSNSGAAAGAGAGAASMQQYPPQAPASAVRRSYTGSRAGSRRGSRRASRAIYSHV